MSIQFRPTVLFLAIALCIPCAASVAQARTTDSAASDALRLEKSTTDVAAEHVGTPGETQARRRGVRFCRIPRHPRDGVPAEVHACPLVFAGTDEAAPAGGAS